MIVRPRTVAPGVESFAARTPTLPPATHTQSYCLGGRELLLVEPATPYEDERRQWLEWARGLATSGRSIVGLFVTHHHVDHVGGTAFFAKALGIPVWAHAETAARLPDVTVDRLFSEGQSITLDGPSPQRWNVLFTPGHAPGHLCLHEPELGHLVVGDMVASVGTILIAPGDGDMREYLTQLARLSALGARTALPAHGEPIDQPSRTFDHYVAHRLARERKVADALAAAGTTGAEPEELVPVAYDDTPRAIWGLAAMSLRAHLVKLEQEGRARRHGSRYTSVS